jgi:sugar/nucleoside kinase (ribokinase family)
MDRMTGSETKQKGEQAMKQKPDVYLFGQVLGTHSFLLKDGFLQPDEYSEIGEQYFLPGGETGTAATVLDSLGISVKIDGTWIGTEVAPMLKDFYADKKVDLSSLCFTESPGVMDYVVIAGLVRSPMGRFQTLFASGKRWWNIPKEEDIAGCKAAAIDPFFREESLLAAELCERHGVPYVTIDCPHDSPLHRNAAVNVVSKECTGEHYAGQDPEAIMEKLMETSGGLTILTRGGGEMLYGRKGEAIHRMKPFDVKVRSTLGAGDTFKAGCVYGLLKGMSDRELVRFASACSGIAISRFPLPLHPPKPEEVRELLSDRP